MPRPVSPYCTRCTPGYHGNYPHQSHETNEHDEWWARMKNADAGLRNEK